MGLVSQSEGSSPDRTLREASVNVFKQGRLTAPGIPAVSVAVIAVSIGIGGGQPSRPTSLPTIYLPTPPAEMTKEELNQSREDAQNAWASHVPVVAETPLELPADAILDGLVAKGHPGVGHPEGMTLMPLPLPVYIIVREGEVASVSKATGEFQIGIDHQDKFQFLIDQVGTR